MTDPSPPTPAGLARDVAGELSADPEVRLTGFIFAEVFESAPAGAWWAPGALTLLGSTTDALTVALPWGVIVAVAPLAEPVLEAYSMNHYTEGFRTPLAKLRPDAVPAWAAPCARAMAVAGRPGGARVVVNRALPDQTGLLTGAETACAFALALRDLYGCKLGAHAPDPWHAPSLQAEERTVVRSYPDGAELLPFDLAGAGLRLMIIDVGAAEAPPGASAAPGFGGDVAVAAAVLRNGEPSRLGPLLTEAHESGVAVLDRALSASWSAGALGGRAIGSCLVVLAPISAVPAIRTAVIGRLAGIAHRPPRFLTVVPAAGARRAC